MYKAKILLLCFLFSIVISGCNPYVNSGNVNTVCLPPLVDFSYALNKIESLNHPGPTVPGYPWVEQATIPILDMDNEHVQSALSFVRRTEGFTEIWVITRWRNNNLSQSKYAFQIYNSISDSWREIPIVLEEPLAEIVQVYLDDTGTILARASSEIGNTQGYINGYTKTPFLFATFREDEGNFQHLDFSPNIPLGSVSFDGEKFWIFEKQGRYYSPELNELENITPGSVSFDGINLWKFEGDFVFYSLNPKSLEIKKHISYQNSQLAKTMGLFDDFLILDNSLAFNEDGSFYFLNETPKENYIWRDMYLFRFFAAKETFEALPIFLKNQPPLQNLFIDRTGNIWLSDYGWMDTKQVWHQIVRSPLFITNKVEGETVVWDNPYAVFNSSDGRIWFGTTNGMVSLDPDKGEWCWFTTYQSNIVEDADHNLWMIADGKLYKYPLQP